MTPENTSKAPPADEAATVSNPHQEMIDTAVALYRAEQYGQARVISDELLRIAPQQHMVLHLAGVIARSQKRLHASAEHLKQALRQAPDAESAAASWFSLGKTLRESRNLPQAEEALRRALQINPNNSDYSVELAEIYADGWKLDLAIETLKHAMNRQKGDAAPCAALAGILVKHGRHQDALIAYDLALARDPGDPYIHLSRGKTLNVLGRFAEAQLEMEKAVQLKPEIEAYSSLAQLKNLHSDSPETQAMLKYWDSAGVAPLKVRIDTGFALARVYDKAEEYPVAFKYLQEANRLKRSDTEYSLEADEAMVQGIMALFTPDFLARYSAQSNCDLAPIFVLGMPRSGTTLTEQMLACHSQVQGGGELPGLTRVAKDLGNTWESRGTLAPGSDEMVAQDLRHAAARYMDMTSHLWRKSRHFTDKMPMNFLHIGLIHLLFPRAKIIYCRRNPAATCFSCYQILFGNGNILYSYDLTEMGKFYKMHERIMEHWRTILPGRVLETTYEDLVENPEAGIRRILTFCDLDFEPACLDFHNLKRPVATASLAQVRKPIYKNAIHHWKNYQAFLGPLFDALEISPASDAPH